MELTITGWLVILFALKLIFDKGLNFIIDPRAMILFAFFQFWGKVNEMKVDFLNDVMLAFSFLICYTMILIFASNKYPKFTNYYENLLLKSKMGFNLPEITKKKQIYIFIFFLMFGFLYTYCMAKIYGSFENSMTRFYVKDVVDSVLYSRIYTLLTISKWLLTFLLLIIKLSNTIYRKSNTIFLLCLFIMLFITIPGGSRGSVLLLIIGSLFADLYAWIILKMNFRKSLFTSFNLGLIAIAVLSALFLTKVRGNDYNSINNVFNDFASFKIKDGINSYQEKETDIMMRDYYYVVKHWGNDINFLPILYSASSIVFNPIPRLFWFEKPVGFGRILAAAKNGVNTLNYDYMINREPSSYAVGVCGEGWANGGLIGVIFYSIIFGMIAGVATKMALIFFYKPGYFSLALAFFFWRTSSCWIRGDLTSILQTIYPLLLLTILLWLMKSKRPQLPLKLK